MEIAGEMTKARMNDLQAALGINFNEFGIMFQREWRHQILDLLRNDWMHGEVQHGSWVVECRLFMKACEEKVPGVSAEFWSELCKDWVFPRNIRNKAAGLPQRLRAGSQEFKVCASENLALVTILAQFAEEHIADVAELAAERESFLHSCLTVKLIMRIKSLAHDVSAQRELLPLLRTSTATHLRSHCETYGTGAVVPKFHYMLHQAGQMACDLPFVIDMFVLERHHLLMKDVARWVHNKTLYSRSVLTEYVVRLLEITTQSGFTLLPDCLLGKPEPLPDHAGVVVAGDFVVDGTQWGANEFAFFGDAAGRVMCGLQDRSDPDGVVYAVVTELERCHVGVTYSIWKDVGKPPTVVEGRDIETVSAWYFREDRIVLCR